MDMDSKPRRRWWQFKLRTLLIAVVVLSIPLAWVGYSLNWKQRRYDFLYPNDISSFATGLKTGDNPPFPLGLFGESPRSAIYIPPEIDDSVANRAAELFPEAEIIRGH